MTRGAMLSIGPPEAIRRTRVGAVMGNYGSSMVQMFVFISCINFCALLLHTL
jgi:hypothetical protein